jgi:hypothetical protein
MHSEVCQTKFFQFTKVDLKFIAFRMSPLRACHHNEFFGSALSMRSAQRMVNASSINLLTKEFSLNIQTKIVSTEVLQFGSS